jgi:cysteine desulfurase/selenocysteine lyase
MQATQTSKLESGKIDQTVYFDNAATSYPKPEVVYVAMDAFARQIGGSGGRSSHRRSLEAANIIDGSRESLAELLGAHGPDCVCVSSNATEGLNLAIYGLAQPERRIITSLVEHNSVRRPIADLRRRFGCEVIASATDSCGQWNAQTVIDALTPDTSLVVLSWASNVTGAVQPIEPVAQACRERNIPLVIDGAQVCGSYPVNFKTLGAAALAFTGHKSLLGPQGTGGLLVDPAMASRIRPLKLGGSGSISHSEAQPENLPDRFESGTLNGHGLSGLKAGTRFLLEQGLATVRAHEMRLWRRFRDGLREINHVHTYGPDDAGQAVSIVSVTVEGMQPTDVGFLLDMEYGILTRTGLHCAPGAHAAIGTLPTGTIRFAIGYANTESDVDAALHALSHIRERRLPCGSNAATAAPVRTAVPA